MFVCLSVCHKSSPYEKRKYTKINLRHYVSLSKSLNLDAANIKYFTEFFFIHNSDLERERCKNRIQHLENYMYLLTILNLRYITWKLCSFPRERYTTILYLVHAMCVSCLFVCVRELLPFDDLEGSLWYPICFQIS